MTENKSQIKNMNKIYSLVFIASLCSTTALSQGTKADYDRAASLKEKFKNKVLFAPEKFQWLGDGKLMYQEQTTKGREFIIAENGAKKPAFDQAKLAGALAA